MLRSAQTCSADCCCAASLLRLFLDHLADYTIGTFDGALVRQDSIDIDAPVQLARIVASVQSIESESEGAMVQAAHAGEREQRKRKAGLSPSEASYVLAAYHLN